MCFIGHGAFGIITKPIWCNYFAVFGIGHDMAYHLMPVVGTIDILCGLSLLFYPTRTVLLWLVIWGTITALLRPLSGEPFAEFIERAGNFGAPLALLILSGFEIKQIKKWFAKVNPPTQVNPDVYAHVITCLRLVAFFLLAGHGWLNLIEKKGIMGQYAALGFSSPALICHIAGTFEIVAAFAVLARPFRPLIFTFLIWKIGTELFYLHWEIFEWVERGGSYGALLALWFALPLSSAPSGNTLSTA